MTDHRHNPDEPERPSTITSEEIEEILERALERQPELEERLRRVFNAPLPDIRLRDAGKQGGEDQEEPTCELVLGGSPYMHNTTGGEPDHD